MNPIDAAIAAAEERLAVGDPVGAARCIEQFEEARSKHPRLAVVWARLLPSVGNPKVLERQMRTLAAEWPHHPLIALTVAEAGTRWVDPWPFSGETDRLAALAVDVLERCLAGRSAARHHATLHLARARALARMSPSAEDEALLAFEAGLESAPDAASGWADLARLHQVRGRWEKGLAAAEHALSLADSRQSRWTAAVCATALADDRAAAHWHALDHHPAGVDAHGRPRIADLPAVEVLLAPELLGGAPAAADAPRAEVVWVTPTSPAHGRITSPTALSLPADFDDVVLWDPVPRGFRQVDNQQTPCFTAIAVLGRGRRRVWRIEGAVDAQGWPADWWLYDLAERVRGAPVDGQWRLITPADVDRGTVRPALTARGLRLTTEPPNPTDGRDSVP